MRRTIARIRKRRLGISTLGSGIVLACMLILIPGCYRRVISAKGIGADASYPERSKSSETEIDKAIDRVFEGKKD